MRKRRRHRPFRIDFPLGGEREDRMRLMRFIVAAALAAAPFVASAQQPVKMRVAYVVPVANWASLLFEKKDLARHNGRSYTFEAVHFQGTPQMITALANHELEIA